jgi:hypothetical protein
MMNHSKDPSGPAQNKRHEYVASREELQIMDAAMASIDSGEVATDTDVQAAFTKFRPA